MGKTYKRYKKSRTFAPPVSNAGGIQIFTDGSCEPNPGFGGWAYIIPELGIERSGHESSTTNNRMEMMACIEALEAVDAKSVIDMHSDSQYVLCGITLWIAGWKRRGWKTAGGEPVKNVDLWERLDRANSRHTLVAWHWVRGHNGHEQNERCDTLANEARVRGLA